MSFTVAQRTHEIGVRMALGAERPDIVRLVIRRCLRLSATGILIGITLSIPIGIWVASQLRGVTGWDPLTYVGVVLLLILVALVAAYLPARRAAGADAILACRYE
jgi:ABC-type antimicrobial peptide transport system permease subunit